MFNQFSAPLMLWMNIDSKKPVGQLEDFIPTAKKFLVTLFFQ